MEILSMPDKLKVTVEWKCRLKLKTFLVIHSQGIHFGLTPSGSVTDNSIYAFTKKLRLIHLLIILWFLGNEMVLKFNNFS